MRRDHRREPQIEMEIGVRAAGAALRTEGDALVGAALVNSEFMDRAADEPGSIHLVELGRQQLAGLDGNVLAGNRGCGIACQRDPHGKLDLVGHDFGIRSRQRKSGFVSRARIDRDPKPKHFPAVSIGYDRRVEAVQYSDRDLEFSISDCVREIGTQASSRRAASTNVSGDHADIETPARPKRHSGRLVTGEDTGQVDEQGRDPAAVLESIAGHSGTGQETRRSPSSRTSLTSWRTTLVSNSGSNSVSITSG